MKISCLGTGTWGFCLARLLAQKEYQVVAWSRQQDLVNLLNQSREHPRLKGRPATGDIRFTTNLTDCLEGSNIIVESLTSQGIRPVFEQIQTKNININVPIVLTSKGIEQKTGHLLSDIILDILGRKEHQHLIGCLSGPSHAEEVSRCLPTSVVLASYDPKIGKQLVDIFTTSYFRLYLNSDVKGVSFGGALKNIIAIACGISDGLQLGCGTKAALMTRGLHEISRLARSQGCKPETLYGLSGMGDLFLTCNSPYSRNYQFGKLLSEGIDINQARKKIGMVIEGIFACRAALDLSMACELPMPIAEMVFALIQGHLNPHEAVMSLMSRSIKQESI